MTREEAIELLEDLDGAIEDNHGRDYDEAFRMAIEALSAEDVKVVRCRDCEYWECNPNTKNYGGCRKVSYDDFEVVMERDDYCSYGKRREDGEA